MGNKVLRQRLRGPTLAAYYPRKTATLEDLQRAFRKHDLKIINPEQEERVENIAVAKLKGKGPPKKKKEKTGEFDAGHAANVVLICACAISEKTIQ